MSLEREPRASAVAMREALLKEAVSPATFREALMRVPPHLRDAWVDVVLDAADLPLDDVDLPRGCAPYLPCSVDAVLEMIEQARIGSDDVFVDVGSGLGRAAILTRLLTGATAIGIEIQAHLVSASRERVRALGISRLPVVHGDATQLTAFVPIGSVFFLYCPFTGPRLEKVLDDLESLARTKPIRLCCVALPPPQRPWLTPLAEPRGELAVYRSTYLDQGRAT